jgi:nucleotide-binding universal stress UspA family protein
MYRFNRLLVAIDFTSKDNTLISYARHIAGLANSSRVYFMHVAEDLEMPDDIRKNYPDISESVDDFAIKRMEKLSGGIFGGAENPELYFAVEEGEPVRNLLNFIRLNDIDLVLVGKSAGHESGSAIAEKLARKAPCSVLIVPEGAQPLYKNVVLATDFSNHSLDALDVTGAFTGSAGLDTFTCLHVYNVPAGYYKTGKSYEQFAAIMEKNATDQFMAQLRLVNLQKVNPHLELILHRYPEEKIISYVNQHAADLLVMGARGRAGGAAILLGSVTEQVIRKVSVPLLAVKKKGAGLDLLEAILIK